MIGTQYKGLPGSLGLVADKDFSQRRKMKGGGEEIFASPLPVACVEEQIANAWGWDLFVPLTHLVSSDLGQELRFGVLFRLGLGTWVRVRVRVLAFTRLLCSPALRFSHSFFTCYFFLFALSRSLRVRTTRWHCDATEVWRAGDATTYRQAPPAGLLGPFATEVEV